MSYQKNIIFLTYFIFILFPQFAKELPNGYKNIQLGMTLEETKNNLINDSSFGYHGERDVSLVPSNQTTLIETDAQRGLGSNFLSHCWFQFYDEKLFIITINVNQNRMDYYSIFTTLTKKYGEPDTINPNAASWKNEQVTVSLEKPLTLKYIDNETFDQLQNYSNIQKSAEEETRQMFLDEL